ncbi:MAG: HEAT repeat domain-containing protein [Planctomycetota bacterium]|nr:HEAT repeat domain-containing protein [Planctomycetota bacterium]
MAKAFSVAMAVAAGLLAGLVLGGCPGPDARGPALRTRFESEDPVDRVAAIRQAAAANDKTALPALVACLSDSESDVRFFAISALRTMTGQDLGYHHYDGEQARREAANRWREYLQAHPPARE